MEGKFSVTWSCGVGVVEEDLDSITSSERAVVGVDIVPFVEVLIDVEPS